MENEKLNFILKKAEALLIDNQFVKRKNKQSYIKKQIDDYQRQERIDFYARRHREDNEAIFISATVGIYYPSVRKIYASLLKDHLADYPIVAGNMGNFIPEGNYMTVYYKDGVNDFEAEREIERNLREGAFYLLETFSNLNSIYEGICNHHPLLKSFHTNVDYPTKVLVISIIYVLQGKEKALSYAQVNIEKEHLDLILSRLQTI